MNKIKMTYERPTTSLLVIRFEQSLLQASIYGAQGAAGQNIENGYEYDL